MSTAVLQNHNSQHKFDDYKMKKIQDQQPQVEKETRSEGDSHGDEANNNLPQLKLRGTNVDEVTRELETGLKFIRKELGDMRKQDRVLAKELIEMRSKIQDIGKFVESDLNTNVED